MIIKYSNYYHSQARSSGIKQPTAYNFPFQIAQDDDFYMNTHLFM
jgi:hypothetical protein